MCEYEGCRVPPEADTTLCILHLEGAKDEARFKEVLYQQIDEEGDQTGRNEADWFCGYSFPAGICFGAQVHRDSTEDAVLPSIWSYVNLGKAVIHGSVNFRSHKPRAAVSLQRAIVFGDVDFRGSSFTDFVSLREATVHGKLDFSNITIAGYVDFTNARINGVADFQNATISGLGMFPGVTLSDYANFRGATFVKPVHFQGATLGYCDFYRCSAGGMRLREGMPRIRGWRTGIERCGVLLTEVSSASSFWKFAQLAYSKNGQRRAADAAFYFMRLCSLRALRKAHVETVIGAHPILTLLLRTWHTVLWILDCLLLRWTTAYGASISQLIMTWFVVIGGFGIAFSLMPRLIQRAGSTVWTLRNWITGFHYSTTTFATLGLGNVGPGTSQLGMVLTSLEAILGAILIALAVLIIGRRFMR